MRLVWFDDSWINLHQEKENLEEDVEPEEDEKVLVHGLVVLCCHVEHADDDGEREQLERIVNSVVCSIAEEVTITFLSYKLYMFKINLHNLKLTKKIAKISNIENSATQPLANVSAPDNYIYIHLLFFTKYCTYVQIFLFDITLKMYPL